MGLMSELRPWDTRLLNCVDRHLRGVSVPLQCRVRLPCCCHQRRYQAPLLVDMLTCDDITFRYVWRDIMRCNHGIVQALQDFATRFGRRLAGIVTF